MRVSSFDTSEFEDETKLNLADSILQDKAKINRQKKIVRISCNLTLFSLCADSTHSVKTTSQ